MLNCNYFLYCSGYLKCFRFLFKITDTLSKETACFASWCVSEVLIRSLISSRQEEPFREERQQPPVSVFISLPAPTPTLSAIAAHQVSTPSQAQISVCSLYFTCSCLSSGFCFLLFTQELHSVDYLFHASGFCPYHSTEILNKVINNLFVQSSGPSFLFYLTSWQHLVLVIKACCMYSPDL